MSVNFQEELSPDMIERMMEFLGSPVVHDRKTFLYDELPGTISKDAFREFAIEANQPVVVEIHDEGEIKTLSDGTRYRVTQKGWKKEITILPDPV